jgi:hypothetical protein
VGGGGWVGGVCAASAATNAGNARMTAIFRWELMGPPLLDGKSLDVTRVVAHQVPRHVKCFPVTQLGTLRIYLERRFALRR